MNSEQPGSFGVHASKAIPMQSKTRKTTGCMNCGEVREIAAHGLCFACYRRDERADAKAADPHTPNRDQRTHSKKLLKSYAAILQGLAELGVGPSEITTVRDAIRPYTAPIWHLIGDRGPEGGNGKGDDAAHQS